MKNQLAHQEIASEQGFERLVGVCLLDKTGEGKKEQQIQNSISEGN